MRKLLIAIVFLGLSVNGCSWLGFGDSSTTTTTVQAQEQPAAEPAPEKTAEPAKKATVKSAAKAPAKGAKSEAQIKAELDKMGQKLVNQSARTLLPNKANKDIKKVGSEWVATYMDVDTQHVATEMRPGANGQYVGFIRYQEKIMQCKGATREAALKAPCAQTGTRRLNELIRYDGRAWQD